VCVCVCVCVSARNHAEKMTPLENRTGNQRQGRAKTREIGTEKRNKERERTERKERRTGNQEA
jgi:hypothetical protein